MATKSQLRFVISAGGEHRTLFSVHENPRNGRLTLPLKHEGAFRFLGQWDSLLAHAMPKRKFQKYSIHPSDESPNNVNVIHHRMPLEGSMPIEGLPPFDTRQVTTAIKGRSRFAFIFCRRCPDLRHPHYLSKKSSAAYVSLGSFDPENFTLIYAVIAAGPGVDFACRLPESINIEQREFKRARLIVLWTFVSLPPLGSMTYHHSTEPPPEGGELDSGMTAEECIAMFTLQCDILETELRSITIAEKCDLVPGQPVLVPIRRYFKDGLEKSPAALEYVKCLQTRVLTL